MAVGVLQSQIGICLNPNDFICHMPIWTCRTPHRLSLNSFCKKYTNISVPICFFKNSPQMGPSSKAKAQMHSKKQKPRILQKSRSPEVQRLKNTEVKPEVQKPRSPRPKAQMLKSPEIQKSRCLEAKKPKKGPK